MGEWVVLVSWIAVFPKIRPCTNLVALGYQAAKDRIAEEQKSPPLTVKQSFKTS